MHVTGPHQRRFTYAVLGTIAFQPDVPLWISQMLESMQCMDRLLTSSQNLTSTNLSKVDPHAVRVKPLPAKELNLNFHSLEVVSR